MATGIGLLSGGLDSILAVKVLQEQGDLRGMRVLCDTVFRPGKGPSCKQAAEHTRFMLSILPTRILPC